MSGSGFERDPVSHVPAREDPRRGGQALATALFARTEVTGFEQMVCKLTPDTIELGLDAALPAVFELRCTIAEFGRGERRQTSTTDLSVPASWRLRCRVRPGDAQPISRTRTPSAS